jgi:hypothetical protein
LWADSLKLRDLFSHWPTIAGLIIFAFATLTALLTALRIFRALPAQRLRQ